RAPDRADRSRPARGLRPAARADRQLDPSKEGPVMTDLTPTPEDKFSFGLWTVQFPGRDPFGDPTRPPMDPVRAVEKLAEIGAYGINFHDDDVVPFGSDDAERDRIIDSLKKALADTGLVVTTA